MASCSACFSSIWGVFAFVYRRSVVCDRNFPPHWQRRVAAFSSITISLLKKSSPDRLRKGLPNLSQWLQFDLIAHAFESSNKLLLNDLSVPLIEIIAS